MDTLLAGAVAGSWPAAAVLIVGTLVLGVVFVVFLWAMTKLL